MVMIADNMLQFRASDKPMIIIIAIEMQIGGCGGGVGGLLEKGVCCPSRFTNLFWREEKGKGERDKKCAVFPQNFFLFVFVSTHNLGEAEELKS